METKYGTAAAFCVNHELVGNMGQRSKLEEKIAELFGLFRDPLYRYLFQILGNGAEAEDLTQEAFLRLYGHVQRGDSGQLSCLDFPRGAS